MQKPDRPRNCNEKQRTVIRQDHLISHMGHWGKEFMTLARSEKGAG